MPLHNIKITSYEINENLGAPTVAGTLDGKEHNAAFSCNRWRSVCNWLEERADGPGLPKTSGYDWGDNFLSQIYQGTNKKKYENKWTFQFDARAGIAGAIRELEAATIASTPPLQALGPESDEEEDQNEDSTCKMAINAGTGIKNIILHGPPGTSKTFDALSIAKALIASGNPNADIRSYVPGLPADPAKKQLAPSPHVKISQDGAFFKEQQIRSLDNAEEKGQWDIVQFHPALTYEDFVRGIQVEVPHGSSTPNYVVRNKIFGRICELAKNNPNKPYILIIDEINRANLPAVLGELIYALEYRGTPVRTPYALPTTLIALDTQNAEQIDQNNQSNNETDCNYPSHLIVPSNLYIIGTMNTADRSIGQMDYAIRRRFEFFEKLPNPNLVNIPTEAKACFKNVLKLFVKDTDPIDWSKPASTLSDDFRPQDVAIGHTFFLENDWKEKFRYQVLPILVEYIKDGVLLKLRPLPVSGKSCGEIEGLLNHDTETAVIQFEDIFKELASDSEEAHQ